MKDKNQSAMFFSEFSKECDECKINVFDNVMDIAKGERINCSKCNNLYKKLLKYWEDLTNKPEEINLIAKNFYARNKLKQIFKSYGYVGVHTPLILPSVIKLEVTNRCNLSCKHCLADSKISDKNELSIEKIKDIILQAKKLGVNSISIVGGEPVLREDLNCIIDYICSLKMNYSISTNGTLLTDKKIKELKRKNLIKFSVSLDGDRDFHNNLRGNINAYDNALRGIELLAENNIDVAVVMVATKENIFMIENVINKAIEKGAKYFVVNDLIPIGRGNDIKNLCLSRDGYVMLNKNMKMYAKKYKDKINILWKGMNPEGKKDSEFGLFIKSKCGAGLTEITIDSKGYILPCPFLPKTSENINQKALKDIWFFSKELGVYQKRNDLEGVCGSCDRKISCSGCRARALGHKNNIKFEDIRCPKTY